LIELLLLADTRQSPLITLFLAALARLAANVSRHLPRDDVSSQTRISFPAFTAAINANEIAHHFLLSPLSMKRFTFRNRERGIATH
jgi:hypothetical protein